MRSGRPSAGTPRGSAQREHERRRARRNARIRSERPIIAALLLALSNTCAGDSIVMMHDVRMPHRRANLDHIVLTPDEVFVIDAKRYDREIRKRDGGLSGCSGPRLFVGGRDCGDLVRAPEPRPSSSAVAACALGTA